MGGIGGGVESGSEDTGAHRRRDNHRVLRSCKSSQQSMFSVHTKDEQAFLVGSSPSSRNSCAEKARAATQESLVQQNLDSAESSVNCNPALASEDNARCRGVAPFQSFIFIPCPNVNAVPECFKSGSAHDFSTFSVPAVNRELFFCLSFLELIPDPRSLSREHNNLE